MPLQLSVSSALRDAPPARVLPASPVTALFNCIKVNAILNVLKGHTKTRLFALPAAQSAPPAFPPQSAPPALLPTISSTPPAPSPVRISSTRAQQYACPVPSRAACVIPWDAIPVFQDITCSKQHAPRPAVEFFGQTTRLWSARPAKDRA